MEYYEKRNCNGVLMYLVSSKNVDAFFMALSRVLTSNNVFVRMSTKPYKGKRYESATWVCVG